MELLLVRFTQSHIWLSFQGPLAPSCPSNPSFASFCVSEGVVAGKMRTAASDATEAFRPPPLIITNSEPDLGEQAALARGGNSLIEEAMSPTDGIIARQRQPQSKLDLFDRDVLIEMLTRQHRSSATLAATEGTVPTDKEEYKLADGTVTRSRPLVLLLHGPPGVGKSAAATALARKSIEEGAWSSVRCTDLASDFTVEVRRKMAYVTNLVSCCHCAMIMYPFRLPLPPCVPLGRSLSTSPAPLSAQWPGCGAGSNGGPPPWTRLALSWKTLMACFPRPQGMSL